MSMIKLGPIGRRRLYNFRANRRGFWSLWIFLVLFFVSLFSEFVANDKPFLVYYDGGIFMPIFKAYPETDFGGEFQTEADYRDPVVAELIDDKGWETMVDDMPEWLADLSERGNGDDATLALVAFEADDDYDDYDDDVVDSWEE